MEQLMTSEEVAELLHVDPVTVRRLVTKGQLSAYRIGADYRFAPTDLEDYLRRQRIEAQQEDTATQHPLNHFTQWVRRALMGKHTTASEVIDRFDRFTKRARNVLNLAQEEAQRFQHNYIGTEHLLLGLVREKDGIAGRALSNLGIDLQGVRVSVEEIIGHGDKVVQDKPGLTPRSKRVIELAVDEARNLNHQFVGTEHLLLGLIREGEGIAAGILEKRGITLQTARTEVMQLLKQHE